MKIPIVDENDNIVEYRERDNRDVNAIYRVTSLWITNSKGEVLLARRAFNKSHDPGKWGPAVAGTVEEGETYESNILKEAEEELGLKNIKPVLGEKTRKHTNWNYFVQQFYLSLDKDISEFEIQKDEVAEIRWFSLEDLEKELKNKPNDFLSGFPDRIKKLYDNQN